MASVTSRVDAHKIEALRHALSRQEFNKTLLKAVRGMSGVIKRKVSTEITSRYSIDNARYGKNVKVDLQASGSSMSVCFRGKVMRLADFAVDRGPPIQVRVKGEALKMDHNTFIVNMHKKKGGDNRLDHHTERHETKTDRVAMMFRRESKDRYPIKAIKTLAIPSAIGMPEVSQPVSDFATAQLEAIAAKVIDKAIARAAR